MEAALTKPGRVSTARWGGPVSAAERYTRGTGVYALKDTPARTWRIWAGCDAHPMLIICRWSVRGTPRGYLVG